VGDLPPKRIQLCVENSSEPSWNGKIGDLKALIAGDLVKIACNNSEVLTVPLADIQPVRPTRVSQMVIVVADGDLFGTSLRVRTIKDDTFNLVRPAGRNRMQEIFSFRDVELVLSLEGRNK
jgi:hypothetical protein